MAPRDKKAAYHMALSPKVLHQICFMDDAFENMGPPMTLEAGEVPEVPRDEQGGPQPARPRIHHPEFSQPGGMESSNRPVTKDRSPGGESLESNGIYDPQLGKTSY